MSLRQKSLGTTLSKGTKIAIAVVASAGNTAAVGAHFKYTTASLTAIEWATPAHGTITSLVSPQAANRSQPHLSCRVCFNLPPSKAIWGVSPHICPSVRILRGGGGGGAGGMPTATTGFPARKPQSGHLRSSRRAVVTSSLASAALTTVKVAAGSYLAFLALLLVLQRSILFPRPMETADPAATGGELIVLRASPALLESHREQRRADAGAATAVVDVLKEEGVSGDLNPLGPQTPLPSSRETSVASRDSLAGGEAARDDASPEAPLKMEGGGPMPSTSQPCVTALHFPAPSADAPTVVYFHGNADQLGWGAAYIGRALHDHFGVGFYGIEYPGYATSRGLQISEASMYLAAEQLLGHLQSRGGLGVDPAKVILFGQSIGGGVAIEMAQRNYGSKLILVAPFLSVQAMARSAFPLVTPGLGLVSWLVKDKFDNAAKAPSVRIPTVVIHGTEDFIVPPGQGQRLAELLRCPLVSIEGGGHNDLFGSGFEPAVLKAIASFAFPERDPDDAATPPPA